MNEFIDQLKTLSNRVISLRNSITTEEATKTAIIMPFFQILGYDVFNPAEFTPEFIADVGIKKGEKVDYAILQDNHPVMLIECKSIDEKLTKHDSQLFRYFGTTPARFGILTNGINYNFYTDLEEPNKMDTAPFFTFDITSLRDSQINEIAKFRKETFDVDTITSNASKLKYLSALKGYLTNQLEKPADKFVRFLVGEIYDGVKTKSAIDKFTPIVKLGINQFITEQVNDKLNAALYSTNEQKNAFEENNDSTEDDDGIVTTDEELECYAITKVILKELIDESRIFYRDNKSYFNVLIDDNIRKWIMRVFFEKHRNFIILNNGTSDKDRTVIDFKHPIDLLQSQNEITKIAERLI